MLLLRCEPGEARRKRGPETPIESLKSKIVLGIWTAERDIKFCRTILDRRSFDAATICAPSDGKT